MGMSFIGSYSGIDQATIDQLMEAERMPLKHMTRKKESIVEKQNAWKDVNTRLNSLFEKMKALGKTSSFETKIAKSSDDKYVSMSAGTSAAEGKYNIKVNQLATKSNVIGGQILPPKEFGGKENTKNSLDIEGSFKVKNFEGEIIEVQVSKEDSLQAIADKINETMTSAEGEEGEDGYIAPKKIGIKATVVDNRLVLEDEETGSRDIKFGGDGKGTLVNLGLDSNSRDLTRGQAAKFNVNGIDIERDTNTVSDAIKGVTINLNKVHDTGQSEIVTISADTEKATKLVQDFVDQYNSTMQFIEEKTNAGDPEKPGSKGALAGESSLNRLVSSLRRAVTGVLDSDKDGINVASKIGITTTDKSGKLSFDKDVFLQALEDNKEDTMAFLTSKGQDGEGLIGRVNKEIDVFISKENGIIKSQNESFERTQKDLTRQIENFEDRMERKEAYYVKTFTALDMAMMKAEDQMNWLAGQVNAMNGGGN